MWTLTVAGKQIPLGITDPDARPAAEAAAAAHLTGPTVAQAVAQYLAQLADRVKPTTLAGYAWHLSEFEESIGSDGIFGPLTHQALPC